MSARKPNRPAKKPEPLRPGDEEIAREEIETYYTRQIEQAQAEFAEAQERFTSATARATAAFDAFRAGERLSDVEAWSIELHAGGHVEIGQDILRGKSTDRAAYDAAKGRHEATARWLRHAGYRPLGEAR